MAGKVLVLEQKEAASSKFLESYQLTHSDVNCTVNLGASVGTFSLCFHAKSTLEVDPVAERLLSLCAPLSQRVLVNLLRVPSQTSRDCTFYGCFQLISREPTAS